MSGRARILDRVRAAQNAAQRAQEFPGTPIPTIDGDLLARFCECAQRLASDVVRVANNSEVPTAVARYLGAHRLAARAVGWPESAALPWREAGIEIEARAANGADAVGITGVFAAIAETGTLMLLSGNRTPASVSLLPETHVAIVHRDQLVGTMEQAWARMRAHSKGIPRAVNFVSGPSRTADVEQTVTLGAHGPRRVLIVAVG